jgi:5-formyltetrahydrofolate cyclo-ligase
MKPTAVMTKTELRKVYKEKRSALSLAQKDKLEDLMLIQFQQLEIEIPALVMTYAPCAKHNEFDPQLITDFCYFRNPAQTLFYPVVDSGVNTMYCAVVNDETVFAPNEYGIDEPVDGLVMFPEEIDLVIVPLLAFDVKGNRVGYGKGYYDRFLKECKDDVIKIGFSFFDAVPKVTDMNKYDIKLDYCITAERIYSF